MREFAYNSERRMSRGPFVVGIAATIATLALVASVLAGWSVERALAFEPGGNGHPTSGNLTNLMGRADDVTLVFQLNATLTCTSNTATSFTFNLNYAISGAPLPNGAHVVVYLSPNNGAISNNSEGNDAAYIAAVQSNETSVDMSGLSGAGTKTFTLTVTTPFQLSGGGVLGVIANDAGGKLFNSKTNSLNCTEATAPTPTPTLTATPTATPTTTPTAVPTATALPVTAAPSPATAVLAAVALPATGGDAGSGSGPSWPFIVLAGALALLAVPVVGLHLWRSHEGPPK